MALPTQVSPPQVALSDVAPSAVIGVDVVAVPVLAGPDGPLLGPGAAELLDELDDDLFALLEAASATGEAGEVVERVVLDTTGLSNPDLRLVLLVGVGAGTHGRPAPRRRRARPARPRTGCRWPPRSVRSATTRACGRWSRGWCSARSSSTGAPQGPQQPPGRAGWCSPGSWTRTPARDVVREALAVAGAGWRVPHARAGALQPEEPRVAGRAGGRGGAARRARRSRSGTRSSSPTEGFGGIVGVGQGSRATRPGWCGWTTRPRTRCQEGAARRAGRQGHHLRHRRPVHQGPRRHDVDEARHDRRRRGARGDGRAGRPRLPGPGHRPAAAAPRTPSAATRSAPATCCGTTAGARPRSPTPTPRAGWCWPTRSPTPSPSWSPTCSSTSPR